MAIGLVGVVGVEGATVCSPRARHRARNGLSVSQNVRAR